MFRRASLPPALSPSIYRREMNVAARLAQGLGHVASTRPSLGLPNNTGLLRGNPRQWRILPQRSGTILRRQVLLRGMRVAPHLRRYIAAPRPTGSVRIGQSLSETNNHCPKRTTARVSPQAQLSETDKAAVRALASSQKAGPITSADEIAKRNKVLVTT